jgi:hypothetical protein
MSYKEFLIPYYFEAILIGFFLFISLEIGVAASAVPFPESWQTFMRNIKSIGIPHIFQNGRIPLNLLATLSISRHKCDADLLEHLLNALHRPPAV